MRGRRTTAPARLAGLALLARPAAPVDGPYEQLAALLRRARELAGLSQEELADRVGLAPNSVSRIELGRMAPKPITVDRWLERTGCAVRLELVTGRR